jgi:pimeloyl-ACP methyl ester carboxylesterase
MPAFNPVTRSNVSNDCVTNLVRQFHRAGPSSDHGIPPKYYRAFPQDVKDNQAFAKEKLTMPVLGMGGSGSFGPIIGEHLSHVATNVQAVVIQNSGHWVAEEQPEAVTDALLKFLPPAR